MCGIAGASLSPMERTDAGRLASALMLAIEERGPHATGVAWEAHGHIEVLKDGVRARKFAHRDHVPATAHVFFTHTRYATHGTPSDNANNHPFMQAGVTGAHNGIIANHRELFAFVGSGHRMSECDSEAVFALLGRSGLPVTSALRLIDGSAALCWFEDTDPTVLHLARVDSSPLVLGHTPNGSLLFASTHRALLTSASACGLTLTKTEVVPEGTYLRVEDGTVISSEGFAPKRTSRFTPLERRALNFV